VAAFLIALIATGTLTNVTLRSVEKNLPNTLLQQLADLKLILEDLAEVVSLAQLTKAAPSPEYYQRLRKQVENVHAAVISLRNTYVFDNRIQASAFHAVVAPAITDVRLWLAEGLSGYGPETPTTIQIVLSRISDAFEKARALNRDSETAAQDILNEQRNRLDRFLFSVNLLFVLAMVITFIMVVLLIRQHLLQRREYNAQAERMRAEAALNESQERFRELAELLPESIFEMDLDGILTYVNRNAITHFGYSQEDFERGLNGFQMVSSEDRPRAFENARRVLSGEKIGLNEYNALRNDGSTFPAIMHSTAKYRDGKPVGLRGIVIDITDTKKLEGQLRQAHKMEAIGTLAGGIAHDFNNLLQAVQGFAELLLLDKAPGEKGYAELEHISRASRRGGELTRQLLTFSRKVESKLEPLDLNLTVEHVRRLLERTIPKMVKIELRLTGNLHQVKADASQIEQVLMNLAVNARDAMPEGGTLTIETQNATLDEAHHRNRPELSPGEYVLLAVTDTGHGMDMDTREHIFDPFFTTKEVGKGTGLGLAMVYGIVKNHSGHVMCQSTPGEGTVFRIYLPAIEQSMEIPQTSMGLTAQQAGTGTILIVDDDDAVRDLGERILQRFGYTVIGATDGESALKIYEKAKDSIDLVILDLIMPGIGGRQCLRRLIEVDPRVKVLVASGHSDSTQIERVREIGAKAFVRKPYDVQELLKLVREVLD
jgi:two-component system, cell cycle sensor histidine kinase and response regulator CckA